MSVLFGGNGTYDPAPLEASVQDMISSFGDVIKNNISAEKKIVVGLVNMRTGRVHMADMRAALDAGRTDCYAEFLLGSSSVPGTFPPRFIDGDMYGDGGMRLGVFLPLLWESLAYKIKDQGLKPEDVRVKIMTIVNGMLSANRTTDCDRVAANCPARTNKLLPIAGRAIGLLEDSVYNYSTFAVRESARFHGFETEFRMAHVTFDVMEMQGCKRSGSFDPVFMKCLYEAGYADGKNQTFRDPFAAHWTPTGQ